MATNIEQLIDSRYGLHLAVSVARFTPPWLGYSIARLAARWIASRRQSSLVRAVRANQWVADGEKADTAALDLAVRDVFENSARSIYEVYHYMLKPQTAGRLFVFEPSVASLIHRPEFDQRGLIITGLHLSSFDMALQWICTNLIKPLVLTIPNPQGGRRMEFEIRQKTGINLVPASVSGIRQAIRHLKQGGMVVTGIDRPMPGSEPRPVFFGRPANLPTHYIYLALKAKVPIMIVIVRLENDGKYHLSGTSPIEMTCMPDRDEELRYNAEKVLATAEDFIRREPTQWAISQPVWPELVHLTP